MRKFLTSTIDNRTHKEIVYSEISLNEASFEIESQTEVLSTKWENDLLKIVTPTRTFYYDYYRRLLLGD